MADKTVALLTKEPGDVKFETDIPATIYFGTVAAKCNTALPAEVVALVAKVPVRPESVMGFRSSHHRLYKTAEQSHPFRPQAGAYNSYCFSRRDAAALISIGVVRHKWRQVSATTLSPPSVLLPNNSHRHHPTGLIVRQSNKKRRISRAQVDFVGMLKSFSVGRIATSIGNRWKAGKWLRHLHKAI